MSAGQTHPVIAALDHPLFACGGKRVAAIKFKSGFPVSQCILVVYLAAFK